MIPILVVTHGAFAEGILHGAQMLVGQSEAVEALSLSPGDNFDEFHEQVVKKAQALDEGEGVLVLVDLLGGSPFNAVALSIEGLHLECLTGLNMGMLLTALGQREFSDLKELTEACKEAAVTGVVDVRQLLSEPLDE